MRSSWPWVALIILGSYHGINPGMGWLFAVALGLQERSRRAVTGALVPIAVGHEASVAVAVVLLGGAAATFPGASVRVVAALVLMAFGLWKLARPNRHPRWVGMRVNRRQLAVWSFVMSSAHGAGLMLVPVLLRVSGPHPSNPGEASHAVRELGLTGSRWLTDAAAVLVHSAAMLAVMAIVAVLVYEQLGVGILRKAWVNLDLVWAGSLVAAGLFTLFT